MGIELSIIVPIAQKKGFLKLFIESLFETVKIKCNVILVNDASEQKSVEYLKQLSPNNNYCNVHIIHHEQPKGSVSSIVEGLKVAPQGDYILLDSDLILMDGWLEQLQKVFEIYPNAGASSGLLLYPQTEGVNYAGITFSEDIGRHLFLNAKETHIPNKPYEIQSSGFGFIYIKEKAFSLVGFPDEKFFNGYEDFDYSLRIKKAGFKIYLNPRAKAYHWERSSGIHRVNNRKRNLGRFWKKHGNYVRPDLWDFTINNIEKKINKKAKYKIIDLCTDRIDAEKLKTYLENMLSIKYYLDLSFMCHEQKEIWLPAILGSESFLYFDSFIFITDNFVRLNGNSYWCQRRKNLENDHVVDLHGNCIPLSEMYPAMWPGSKIR